MVGFWQLALEVTFHRKLSVKVNNTESDTQKPTDLVKPKPKLPWGRQGESRSDGAIEPR